MFRFFIIIMTATLGALINTFIIPSNFQYVFGYMVGIFMGAIIFVWRD